MSERIRVGIVGCGKIANVEHAPRYRSLRGIEIVSLLDVRPGKVRALRDACAPRAVGFTEPGRFFASGLDAVSVCTPNGEHFPCVMAALKAGCHVLCEKPLAGTVADCSRMIAAAKKAGKVLHVNQSFHYMPVYVTIAELVNDGAVGRPIHLRCIRAAGSTPDRGWSPGAKWFVSKAAGGGLIMDIGVHMADLLKWIGGDITEVCAYADTRTRRIDVPDNVTALLRFESGATGVLELSWTIPTGAGLIEVYGSEGTLRQGFSQEHPIELTRVVPEGKRPRVLYPEPKKNIRHSHQRFVDAVRGVSPSPTPGELGRGAVALCEAIARSGETRQFVKVRA